MTENIIVSIWKDDPFAGRIAAAAGQTEDISALMQSRTYLNGEYNPTFQQIDPTDISKGFASKGKNVFIIAVHNPIQGYSSQEVLARTILAAKAARDNDAKKVIAVMPDLLYGRADRSSSEDPKNMGGKSFSLEALAQSLAWNVDNVLTLHPHSKNTKAIFEKVYSRLRSKKQREIVYALSPVPIIAHYLIGEGNIDSSIDGKNAVLLIPDKGAVTMGNDLYERIGLKGLRKEYCDKNRVRPNDPNGVSVKLQSSAGVLEGKDVIFVDDGIDTAGTLVKAMENIPQARSRIAYATHAWLAGEFPDKSVQQRLLYSTIDLLIFGNTHPDRVITINEDLLLKKVIFFDYSRFFADAIVNCVAHHVNPQKHYRFNGLDDVMLRAGTLYNVIDKRIKQIRW